ncbi:unnamed protein product [Ixodes hexagonus]
METSGAVKIFTRSFEARGLKYTSYIGDGDSKTFLAVRDPKPHDSDVEKHECIGHVQKRMGTRQGFAASRSKRRLTEKDIDSLQYYYGKAIRENTHALEAMRKAVWAIYFHKLSTDEDPNHGLCPPGESSWCGYNRSLALGSAEPYQHKNFLPETVMTSIKPTFQALAAPELQRKCLQGECRMLTSPSIT